MKQIEELVKNAIEESGFEIPDSVPVTRPDEKFGDFATSVALTIAANANVVPRKVAESIADKLKHAGEFESVEVAGAGFINMRMSSAWFAHRMHELSQPWKAESRTEKLNIEFISANPTGPLHIGNARGGPIGEMIARVMERVGYEVTREFYINDVGGQADKFAASVLHFSAKRFGMDVPFPEGGYPEHIIEDIVQSISEEQCRDFLEKFQAGDSTPVRVFAITLMVERIKTTTKRMGIHFDKWTSQSWLVDSGLSAKALDALKEHDAALEKDGAVWLKSGLQDDDRETVLVKSNAVGTYFLDDIAYHWDKLVARGFSKAIVLLGANHFGHIPRMRAGIQGIGLDPARYEGVLYQYVQLKQGGQVVGMSKREGNVITADEVLNEVPLDVFNYFMLSKSSDTHMDFDLQLAKDTSEKNPVYYIQYAHARICSLLRIAEEKGMHPAKQIELDRDLTSEERQLIPWLDEYRSVVEEVAETYRTHLIPTYSYELATRFHHLYARERIVTDDVKQSEFLLLLVQATAATLKDALHLMNINAPEKL